ncbi:MAG: MFS transporter [Desulfovibrio sp.]|nr:MFS transporter [Desulfovibrio sp.]
MPLASFTRARLACASFFAASCLGWSLLLSRLPALKAQTQASEAEIGLALLAIGASGLAALLSSARILGRTGSRKACLFGTLGMLASLPLASLAQTPLQLSLLLAAFGFAMALVDMAANTQGMLIEKRYRKPAMSMLHAFYGLGVLAGSLSGSLCAALGLGPFANVSCAFLPFALLLPWAHRHLQPDEPRKAEERRGKAPKKRLPAFVVFCGLAVMCAYAAEGAAGDWGSLFLATCKGADEQTAALAYGAFGTAACACRFFGDRLRSRLGERPLAVAGSLAAFGGVAVLLWGSSPWTCLGGCLLLGAGLSPIGPIYFSLAGRVPGVDPVHASACVSTLAYGALLVFPAILGGLAQAFGLDRALLLPLVLCALLSLASFVALAPKAPRGSRPGPANRTPAP